MRCTPASRRTEPGSGALALLVLPLVLAGAALANAQKGQPTRKPVFEPESFICEAADFYFEGDVEDDHLGAAADGGRDWDGDGLVDYVFGGSALYHAVAPDAAPGMMQLYLGPLVPGPEVDPGSRQPWDVRVNGESGGSGFGGSASFLGDIDGDGREDLAVGAWNWSTDPAAADPLEQGALYVFLGRDTSELPTGTAGVFSAGELGDAPAHAGITTKIIRGGLGQRLGWSVARLGDIDGDGYDDFAVGAPGNGRDDSSGSLGNAYVFYGHPTYWNALADVEIDSAGLSAHMVTLAPPPPSAAGLGDRFGYSLACAGDLTGDGRNEIFVGAPRGDVIESAAGVFPGVPGPGYAVLYAGSSAPDIRGVVFGENDEDAFGTSVTSLFHDVDGDGVIDLAVGAPGWDAPLATAPDNTGRAYLLSGADVLSGAALPVERTIDGEFAGDRFGYRVAGDPFHASSGAAVARFAVSAPYYDRPAVASVCANPGLPGDVGKVYVYRTDVGLLSRSYMGEAGRDHLGFALAWIGDVGGAQFGELLCTGLAWPADAILSQVPEEVGRAYLHLD